MERFKCLMFVDDNYMTNYYHKEILMEAELADKLLFFDNPSDALDYLEKKAPKDYVKPDIIFLDIHMPEMSGWEFVDAYQERVKDEEPEIVILSDSLNPLDPERARQNPRIKSFRYKPLSIEYLLELTGELELKKN
ncbi:MAG: response regulator [Bacteroidota bacterium]